MNKKQSQWTPWGESQTKTILADGIIDYTTASHGGIWLSEDRRKAIPESFKSFLGTNEWLEEDCDWAIAYVIFENDIREYGAAYKFDEHLAAAKATLKHYHTEITL